jgi:hypothetical protein
LTSETIPESVTLHLYWLWEALSLWISGGKCFFTRRHMRCLREKQGWQGARIFAISSARRR